LDSGRRGTQGKRLAKSVCAPTAAITAQVPPFCAPQATRTQSESGSLGWFIKRVIPPVAQTTSSARSACLGSLAASVRLAGAQCSPPGRWLRPWARQRSNQAAAAAVRAAMSTAESRPGRLELPPLELRQLSSHAGGAWYLPELCFPNDRWLACLRPPSPQGTRTIDTTQLP